MLHADKMKKYYQFAGIELEVHIPEKWMFEKDGQLAPFRVDHAENPHRLTFKFVYALSAPTGDMEAFSSKMREYQDGEKRVRYIGAVSKRWENAHIRAESGKTDTFVQVKASPQLKHISVRTVLDAMNVEHLVTENNGFIFHCSYIVYKDKAILFTAPSGTGKSTQADLWQKYRDAEIINGDRAAVRMVDGMIIADGIPFSGSSQYCENRSVEIAAIVYLAQSHQNSIRRLQGAEAFSRIWEGVSVNAWYKGDIERVSGVVQVIAKETPVYYLACKPDESAVIVLEEMLRKQGFV